MERRLLVMNPKDNVGCCSSRLWQKMHVRIMAVRLKWKKTSSPPTRCSTRIPGPGSLRQKYWWHNKNDFFILEVSEV